MCEYCENREPIIHEIKQFKDRIEKVIAGIDDCKMKTSTFIDGIMVRTARVYIPPALAEAEIRFCPMCGRELKESE